MSSPDRPKEGFDGNLAKQGRIQAGLDIGAKLDVLDLIHARKLAKDSPVDIAMLVHSFNG